MKNLLNTPAMANPNNRIEVYEDPRTGRFKIVLSQNESEGRGTIVIQQGPYGPYLSFVNEAGVERCFALVDLFYNSDMGHDPARGRLNMCLYNPMDEGGDTPAFVRYMHPEHGPLHIETETGMMDHNVDRLVGGWSHKLTLKEEYHEPDN